MRLRSSIPLVLALFLLAGVSARPAAAQVDATIDFNGDNDPTNPPNSQVFEPDGSGETPIDFANIFIADTDTPQQGDQMIIVVQDDPILRWNLTIVNRTDLGGEYGQAPEEWSSLLLTLTPPSGLEGRFFFLNEGLDVTGFDQILVTPDGLNLAVFNTSPETPPIRPDQRLVLNFKMMVPQPIDPEQFRFRVDIRPNYIIPEPGTLALAAAGLLPLLGTAIRRRSSR